MAEVARLEKRTALLYADGSIGVQPEGWPLEDVYKQRESDDRGAEPKDRTKIARVTLVIDEIILDPTNMRADQEFCGGCNQAIDVGWTYCPYCGVQPHKNRPAKATR